MAAREIERRQNDSRSLAIMRAVTVAHLQTQQAQAASFAMSAAVAGLGILAAVTPRAVPPAAVIGTLRAAVYALVVAPAARRSLRIGATLQEMFDTEVLALPWNHVLTGDPLSDEEVSRFSRRFRGDERRVRDYYLVAAVRAPYDVLFCLEQNLAWGSRVRRRYAGLLITVVTLWCAAGIMTALAAGTTVGALLNAWLLPSLGLLLLCSDISRAQISVARERGRVLGLLRRAIDDTGSPHLRDAATSTSFARQVQDALFLARSQQPRTPQWFFRLMHDDDLRDFRYKMHAIERRTGSRPAERLSSRNCERQSPCRSVLSDS